MRWNAEWLQVAWDLTVSQELSSSHLSFLSCFRSRSSTLEKHLNCTTGREAHEEKTFGVSFESTWGASEDLHHCLQSPNTSHTRQSEYCPSPHLLHCLTHFTEDCHPELWLGKSICSVTVRVKARPHSTGAKHCHWRHPTSIPSASLTSVLGILRLCSCSQTWPLFICSWPDAVGALRVTWLFFTFSPLRKDRSNFPHLQIQTQNPRKELTLCQPVLSDFDQYLFQAWARYLSKKGQRWW